MSNYQQEFFFMKLKQCYVVCGMFELQSVSVVRCTQWRAKEFCSGGGGQKIQLKTASTGTWWR